MVKSEPCGGGVSVFNDCIATAATTSRPSVACGVDGVSSAVPPGDFLPCHRHASMLLPESNLSGFEAWQTASTPPSLAEFFPEHHSSYYAVPLDPDSAMCLEVFTAGMDLGGGREMAAGMADCRPRHAEQVGPIRRFSTPGSSSPGMLYDFCGARSPKALSDSGKQVKPQYTTELDVLCRICGDRASGYHYGVHSCEGCKGFFRRTLKKQLVYKPCQMGRQCKIDAGTRNKCQHCRLQRCLNAGMSQDAVRFGRMPKSEREKLMADKEELSSSSSKRIVELRTLSDIITAAFRDTFHHTIFFKRPEPVSSSSSSSSSPSWSPFSSFSMASSCSRVSSFDGLGGCCDGVRGGGGYQCCPVTSSTSSASPVDSCMMMAEVLHTMSESDFHDREVFWRFQELFLPVLEASVKFAKRLPGFAGLPMPDQIELVKQNAFMVIYLALPLVVDNDLIRLDTHWSHLRIYRNSPSLCGQLQRLLQHPLTVGDRLRAMLLTKGEMALFAAVLLTSERPGLTSPRTVERLQGDLIEALRLELKHNHPKDRHLLARLLLLVPDLVQIVEEFGEDLRTRVLDPSPAFSRTKPLLREIFDLCSADGCFNGVV